MQDKFIFLFDGGCPLCLRETRFLKKKDSSNKINFIDINNDSYNPSLYKGISYAEAMSNLHGILENGDIIKGLDVLAYSYKLVGLGWVYFPLKIEFLATANSSSLDEDEDLSWSESYKGAALPRAVAIEFVSKDFGKIRREFTLTTGESS